MLGFVIGTLCLVGLVKVGLGHRHCYARYGRHHHGHHHRGFGGRGFGRPGGFGERAALRWLFEHLDTTHGQEKVILEAVEELRGPAHKARQELWSTAGDLSDAMKGETFDHARTADTWVRQDKALEQLRLALTTAMARVHEVLDAEQRKALAELIARRVRPDFV